MTVTPWGLWLEPTVPAARLVEMAVAAEEAGAEVCLVADEGNGRDVWVTLGAIAAATERIVVGPGVTNPFTRHPVTTATAVATLAEMAPGRVWAGLGAGAPSTLAPIGFEPERPLPALRESMATAQQLLDGESAGRAFLGWFEGHVPLVIGGRGRLIRQLAIDHADWYLVAATPIEELAEISGAVRAGMCKVAWTTHIATDDHERAKVLEVISTVITQDHVAAGHHSGTTAPLYVQEHFGVDQLTAARVRRVAENRVPDKVIGLLPDELVDRFALAGSVAQCRRRFAEMADLVDLVLVAMNEPDPDLDWIGVAAEVFADRPLPATAPELGSR